MGPVGNNEQPPQPRAQPELDPGQELWDLRGVPENTQ